MILETNGGKEPKKLSASNILKRQAEQNWLIAKQFHPKQVLSFVDYEISPSIKSCNCVIDFTSITENSLENKTIEFSTTYRPTIEEAKSELLKIAKTNKLSNYSELTDINVREITPLYNSEKRKFLHIGKIKFSYNTSRGKSKEDIRIFVLNHKPSDNDLINEFNLWISNYNEQYPYRALLNHEIISVVISSISDISTLDEIKNLGLKDKKRVIINRTTESHITLNKTSVEYTTDKNKKRKGEFLIPIATIAMENQFTNNEFQDLINNNRQRKVSNVKILGTNVLSVISL